MLKSARLSFGTFETSPSGLSHPTFRRTGDTPQRDWQINECALYASLHSTVDLLAALLREKFGHNTSSATSHEMIAHGEVEQARRILADLAGLDVNDEHVTTDVKEIEFAVVFEREHGVSWGDLLRGRTGDHAGTSTIRRLVLGMGTQIMQQLSGINVTSYYLPTVLISSVGLSNGHARLLAACNSVSYLLFSLVAIPNVERWGRRNLMMYAAAG